MVLLIENAKLALSITLCLMVFARLNALKDSSKTLLIIHAIPVKKIVLIAHKGIYVLIVSNSLQTKMDTAYLSYVTKIIVKPVQGLIQNNVCNAQEIIN
jgi:hypothetical protein